MASVSWASVSRRLRSGAVGTGVFIMMVVVRLAGGDEGKMGYGVRSLPLLAVSAGEHQLSGRRRRRRVVTAKDSSSGRESGFSRECQLCATTTVVPVVAAKEVTNLL